MGLIRIVFHVKIFEGVFLRDISIGEELQLDPAFEKVVEWNVPKAPYIGREHCYRTDDPTRPPRSMRMVWFSFENGAAGIIAAHGEGGIRGLYFHYESVDTKIIYEDLSEVCKPEDLFWTFFPLSSDEHLSEIWIRQPPTVQRFSPSILAWQKFNGQVDYSNSISSELIEIA